jgi:hypothetical protein
MRRLSTAIPRTLAAALQITYANGVLSLVRAVLIEQGLLDETLQEPHTLTEDGAS